MLTALQPNTDIYLQNQGLVMAPLQTQSHFSSKPRKNAAHQINKQMKTMNDNVPVTENNNNTLFYSMSFIKQILFHSVVTEGEAWWPDRAHLVWQPERTPASLWNVQFCRTQCDAGLDTSVAESRNQKWWHGRILKHSRHGHMNFKSEGFLKWTTYFSSKADTGSSREREAVWH